MPGFVFALRVPARHVNVVHSAIMEWRTFGIVPLKRHVARCHVTHSDNREVPNLSFSDETPDVFVIPSIPVEKIYRNETPAGLNLTHKLPLSHCVGRDRLLGQHVLSICQGLPNLLRSCVSESKQSHDIDGRISKNRVGALVDFSSGHLL